MIIAAIGISFVFCFYFFESWQSTDGSKPYYADLTKTPLKTSYILLMIAIPIAYMFAGYSVYAFDIMNISEQERIAASVQTRAMFSLTTLTYIIAPLIFPFKGLSKTNERIIMTTVAVSILLGIAWTLWSSLNDFVFYFLNVGALGLIFCVYMYSVRF